MIFYEFANKKGLFYMLLVYKFLLWKIFVAFNCFVRGEVTVFDRFFIRTLKIRKVHSSDEK